MLPVAADIALILFARTAEEEVHHKILLPGQTLKKQKALFNHLNTQAENTLKATKLPYYIFHKQDQVGNTFGQRLFAAIATVFNQGYKKVLVIGNDCPGLGTTAILKATGKLSQQDVVIGPTDKGGIYLFGLNQDTFYKLDNLDDIRWQTAQVTQDLENLFCIKAARVKWLKPNIDLNQPIDLKKIVTTGSATYNLRRIYYSSLDSKSPRFTHESFKLNYSLPAISHLVFRGPPQLV